MPVPTPALSRLAERLQVDPEQLSRLERLDESTLDGFAEVVGRAQERDEAEIEQALQETLRFVPRILRGRVKKMLFPEGS